MPLSIHALPIDIIYRIFDHLKPKDLFIAANNVNQRLNAILHSYQRFQTLTILDLTYNKIGDRGAEAIGEALQTNRTLTTLDFYGNRIEAEDAQVIDEALQRNRTFGALSPSSPQ